MSLLTGSANTIKYVLFVFNIVFLVTGLILLGIGVGVTSTYSYYEVFLANRFFSIPTFLIVIGAFIIIISFFGCWGALKENYCLVLSFSVMLGIIFILELSAGISGYVLRNDAYNLIETTMYNQIKAYDPASQNTETKMWDDVQRGFECCGVQSYANWSTRFGNDLPMSCCRLPIGAVGNLSCTVSSDVSLRYSDGCLLKFSNFISTHAVSLGAAGVVIAIIQFFGVLFACYIAREIKIKNGITGFI